MQGKVAGMRTWYYSRNDEIHGPFSDSEILMLVRTRRLQPDDPVTNDQLDLWYPAGDFTGFDFPEPPPPPADAAEETDADEAAQRPKSGADAETEPERPPGPLELKTKSALPVPDLPLPPGLRNAPKPASPPAPAVEETVVEERVVEVIEEIVEQRPPPQTEAAEIDADFEDDGPPAGLTVYTKGQKSTGGHAPKTEDALAGIGSDVSATVMDGVVDREWHPGLTVFHGKKSRRGKHDKPVIEYGGIAEHRTNQRPRWWQECLAASNSRVLLIVLAVPILLAGPTFLLRGCDKRSNQGETRKTQTTEQNSEAATVLGEYLAEKFPGSRTLVVMAPEGSGRERRKRREALVGALEKGFAEAASVHAVDYPKFPVIVEAEIGNTGSRDHVPTSWTPPLQYWYSAEVLDKLIAKYPQCNLIVSFVSLPKDYDRMQMWSKPPKKRPRIAVAAGNIAGLREAIARNWVVAAVDHRPTTAGNAGPAAQDNTGAALSPCRLVTPENVNSLAESHPHLFYE